ncbi:E3 ubiquitin-protein ligase AMFR-like [Gigantopelta aegis]|uniref:E3 ubiquitin-protein ligase AMFR-like n=1 Tax=Gigantopelta aegis TaxID=1735272 RepID=UPI001B88D93B|nr:E3 ubiquitin-protein ligase AMFR-like [Gigantopelta aegis]
MPAILLERIPLPSLQFYTSFTVLLLASAIFYAHQSVTDVGETPPTATTEPEITSNDVDVSITPGQMLNHTLPYDTYHWNFLFVLTTETWCVWILVNTAYCGLILVGKVIQQLVFGDLRVSEQQHLKDKFWNFVFYKFIFIFGVMNVQTMEEVVLWVAWFSVLGFFHLLTQLCKDRFEYLSFSPMTPRSAHIKLLSLLFVILFSCAGLLVVCIYTGLEAGLTILAFMGAECLLLGLRTLYVLVRYFIHLWDMSKEGVWENRSIYVYYTELVFELAALAIDFCHHLHMLLWGNIFLSMASLVICMQLRYLFYEFQRRVKRHKNYLRVVKNVEAKFPMAMQEDIEKNADDCAICWERMESARKLPCSHLFHNSCLRSWLEQDTSCPTCRMSLSDEPSRADPATPDGGDNIPPPPAPPNQETVNHFFHFDGSRYVSWLPSFSVEVTHTNLLPGQQTHIQTSQLDNMARQVQQVFPSMPLTTILDDLRVTRSVDLTIDSILDGRLLAPPATMNRPVARDEEFDSSGAAHSLQVQEIHLPTTVSRTGAMGLRSHMAENTDTEIHHRDLEVAPSTSGTSNIVRNLPSASSAQAESDDHPSPFGGRFSKSATERMTMLQQRKNAMLEHARRKYFSKDKSQLDSEPRDDLSSTQFTLLSDESSDTNSDRSRQREVMFQAVQRRLQQPPSTES